jgi:hypothetical protein
LLTMKLFVCIDLFLHMTCSFAVPVQAICDLFAAVRPMLLSSTSFVPFFMATSWFMMDLVALESGSALTIKDLLVGWLEEHVQSRSRCTFDPVYFDRRSVKLVCNLQG